MSKWINTAKFEEFKTERSNDNTEDKSGVSFARKWINPKMGTQSKPKEYHIRLIPDPQGEFYKKFYYHMFQSGESWNFILCPKTHNFDDFCPWCTLTQTLYQGSDSDKKRAYEYKRKEKFVGNIFVVKDPRDVDEQDPEKYYTGKTFLYEFPATIEKLIKKEVTDVENGWGYKIFDPEDGYNMIISIGAKAADKNGKVWPDYSLTGFAKRPSSIGDDVDSIMETTQDIMEYLGKSQKTDEEHIALLKSEMVYDDVAAQVERFMDVSKKETTKQETQSKNKKTETSSKQEDNQSDDIMNEVDKSDNDQNFEELLKDF